MLKKTSASHHANTSIWYSNYSVTNDLPSIFLYVEKSNRYDRHNNLLCILDQCSIELIYFFNDTFEMFVTLTEYIF